VTRRARLRRLWLGVGLLVAMFGLNALALVMLTHAVTR